MLDFESQVKDLLETEYGIEERIEKELNAEIARLVSRWMDRHNFDSVISDYVELSISDTRIEEAIESTIEEFVEDAF